MTKEKLAIEVVERLKRNIQMPDVLWIMIRRGNCWSACGWQHSVRMQESM